MFDWKTFFIHHRIPHKAKGSKLLANCPCPSHGCKDIDYFLMTTNSGGHCWLCGKKSGIELVEHFLGCSRELAFKTWKDFNTLDKQYYTPPVANAIKTITLPGKAFTPIEYKYLQSRHLTEEDVDLYDLRSGGIVDPYWKFRIVTPLHNQFGTIVSARGRLIYEGKPKYKALHPNLEVAPHKDYLYNEHLCLGNKIVVFEGEFDAMAWGPGGVGTYGTDFTPSQLTRLSKYATIYILRDNDAAGSIGSKRLADQLAMLTATQVEVVTFKVSYGAKDVSALLPADRKALRKELYT